MPPAEISDLHNMSCLVFPYRGATFANLPLLFRIWDVGLNWATIHGRLSLFVSRGFAPHHDCGVRCPFASPSAGKVGGLCFHPWVIADSLTARDRNNRRPVPLAKEEAMHDGRFVGRVGVLLYPIR